MTLKTCSSLLVPCSSRPGGRPQAGCSSVRPFLYEGRAPQPASEDHHHHPHHTSSQGRAQGRGPHMNYTRHLGPRGLPAYDAILKVLADHQWHTHQELVDAATAASDLAPKTIDKLIRSGWRARHYTRTTAGHPLRTTNAIYRQAATR